MTSLDNFNNSTASVKSAAATATSPAVPSEVPAVVTAPAPLRDLGGDAEWDDAGAEPPEDKSAILALLESRRFRLSKKPDRPREVWRCKGTVVSTPGNLTTITAQSKAGKSAIIGAMKAAICCVPDSDCIGFASSNPKGLAVVHIDTEQSDYDHWAGEDRSLRRAGLTNQPSWWYSYCLTGESVERVNAALAEAVVKAAEECGGLHSILLDGAADMVRDVNDSEECNQFVLYLMRLARKYDCPIICVLHLNPCGEKSRGHLGSNLERKSESNLRIDKHGDISVLWSDKQRGQNMPKESGPRFIYVKKAGMHITTTDMYVEEKKTRKKAE